MLQKRYDGATNVLRARVRHVRDLCAVLEHSDNVPKPVIKDFLDKVVCGLMADMSCDSDLYTEDLEVLKEIKRTLSAKLYE